MYNRLLRGKYDAEGTFLLRRIAIGSPRTGAACAPGPLPRWEGLVNDFVNPPRYFSSFKVDGATVKAFIDPAVIGSPASFEWQSLSRTRPAGSGAAPRDFAPNICCASFSR